MSLVAHMSTLDTEYKDIGNRTNPYLPVPPQEPEDGRPLKEKLRVELTERQRR